MRSSYVVVVFMSLQCGCYQLFSLIPASALQVFDDRIESVKPVQNDGDRFVNETTSIVVRTSLIKSDAKEFSSMLVAPAVKRAVPRERFIDPVDPYKCYRSDQDSSEEACFDDFPTARAKERKADVVKAPVMLDAPKKPTRVSTSAPVKPQKVVPEASAIPYFVGMIVLTAVITNKNSMRVLKRIIL